MSAVPSVIWFNTVPYEKPSQCLHELQKIWVVVPPTSTVNFIEQQFNMIL